jgi:hypothetical protein
MHYDSELVSGEGQVWTVLWGKVTACSGNLLGERRQLGVVHLSNTGWRKPTNMVEMKAMRLIVGAHLLVVHGSFLCRAQL